MGSLHAEDDKCEEAGADRQLQKKLRVNHARIRPPAEPRRTLVFQRGEENPHWGALAYGHPQWQPARCFRLTEAVTPEDFVAVSPFVGSAMGRPGAAAQGGPGASVRPRPLHRRSRAGARAQARRDPAL